MREVSEFGGELGESYFINFFFRRILEFLDMLIIFCLFVFQSFLYQIVNFFRMLSILLVVVNSFKVYV